MDLEGMQQLQEVDIQRDQAKRELQAVLDQLSDPPFIDQLDAELEAQEEEARLADQAVREAHAVVQTAQRRIEVTDQRLYSGSITDHRTLEELQRDLYSQRQQLPPLTEAENRATQEAEHAHDASGWLQQLRTGALDVWNARQSELDGERHEAQERVDEFSRQAELLREKLTQDDLDTYDQYRPPPAPSRRHGCRRRLRRVPPDPAHDRGHPSAPWNPRRRVPLLRLPAPRRLKPTPPPTTLSTTPTNLSTAVNRFLVLPLLDP